MKFGGTSMADITCIRQVAEITKRRYLQRQRLAIVVSAMSGVTDELIEAGAQAARGLRDRTKTRIERLIHRYHAILGDLNLPQASRRINRKFAHLFSEAEALCRGIEFEHRLTAPLLDRLSGIGERLSAPLAVAALAEAGVPGEAIEATELIVTGATHGAAEPHSGLTRVRCRALDPLLARGTVPVVTGFIAATAGGVPTTLGRNGSDFSATILAAAIGADEVIKQLTGKCYNSTR